MQMQTNQMEHTPEFRAPRRRISWMRLGLGMLLVGFVLFIVGIASGSRAGNFSFVNFAYGANDPTEMVFMDTSAFSSLHVDTRINRVEIVRGDHFRVYIDERYRDGVVARGGALHIDTRELEPRLSSSILDIPAQLANAWDAGSWSFNYSGLVRVYIPEGHTVSVHASTVSGAIVVSDVDLSNGHFRAVSGRVQIDGNSVAQAVISAQTTSGGIRIGQNSAVHWATLNAQSTSGSVRVDGTPRPDSHTNLQTTSGSINAVLQNAIGSDAFAISMRSTSGSQTLNGERVSSHRNRISEFHGGPGTINMQSTSGSVRLGFRS